jgi:hypothetical protein
LLKFGQNVTRPFLSNLMHNFYRGRRKPKKFGFFRIFSVNCPMKAIAQYAKVGPIWSPWSSASSLSLSLTFLSQFYCQLWNWKQGTESAKSFLITSAACRREPSYKVYLHKATRNNKISRCVEWQPHDIQIGSVLVWSRVARWYIFKPKIPV